MDLSLSLSLSLPPSPLPLSMSDIAALCHFVLFADWPFSYLETITDCCEQKYQGGSIKTVTASGRVSAQRNVLLVWGQFPAVLQDWTGSLAKSDNTGLL